MQTCSCGQAQVSARLRTRPEAQSVRSLSLPACLPACRSACLAFAWREQGPSRSADDKQKAGPRAAPANAPRAPGPVRRYVCARIASHKSDFSDDPSDLVLASLKTPIGEAAGGQSDASDFPGTLHSPGRGFPAPRVTPVIFLAPWVTPEGSWHFVVTPVIFLAPVVTPDVGPGPQGDSSEFPGTLGDPSRRGSRHFRVIPDVVPGTQGDARRVIPGTLGGSRGFSFLAP